jgi:SOS response regulatory protein OraA/RecX
MGYDSNMIDDLLQNIKYESNALKNDYEKAKKKYSDGTKIINYLLRKGYSYEEIKTLTN